jgi:hypothetical protein
VEYIGNHLYGVNEMISAYDAYKMSEKYKSILIKEQSRNQKKYLKKFLSFVSDKIKEDCKRGEFNSFIELNSHGACIENRENILHELHIFGYEAKIIPTDSGRDPFVDSLKVSW